MRRSQAGLPLLAALLGVLIVSALTIAVSPGPTHGVSAAGINRQPVDEHTRTPSKTRTPTITRTPTNTWTPTTNPTATSTPMATNTPTATNTPGGPPTPTNTPNNGNTVVLSDAAQIPPAAGNGMVGLSNGNYQRLTSSSNGTEAIGYVNGTIVRSYIEWDTTNIPKNLILQSVALILNVKAGYGSGNTVNVVKLVNPISSYPNTQLGNQQLFSDLGSAPVYYASTNIFQNTGNNLLTLLPAQPSNTLLTDLQDAIANNRPFGIGFVGSNENSAFTAFLAKQDITLPDQHPALVIFSNGMDGFAQPPLRPLRTGFWDGNNYFQFVMGQQGQVYYTSPDAVHWTLSGTLSQSPNRQFSVWYAGNETVYAAFQLMLPPPNQFSADLDFVKGTISGNSISWGSPNTIFASQANPKSADGFGFPSLVVDTNGWCWVLARHYANNAQTSGLEVKRSNDPTCTSWSATVVLIPQSFVGNYRDRGGYVVPLTNGKVYMVYKDTNGTAGQLYGRLYDGQLENQETIDLNAALGVYEQGISVVASGDKVYLASMHGDNHLRFGVRTSSWGPSTLVDGSSNFYTPSLTLDTGSGNLYLAYRTTSTYDLANGQLFYQVGVPSGGQVNWSGPNLLSASSWGPVLAWQPVYAYSVGLWAMASNYTGNGKVFAAYVDGGFGIVTIPILP